MTVKYKFKVTGSYLATGMNGVASEWECGVFEAESPDQAKDMAILEKYPDGSTPEPGWTLENLRSFERSCLKATQL